MVLITGHIDCPQRCGIPEGVEITPVPRPKHDWSDVAVCPGYRCGRAFLVRHTAATPPSETRTP